MRAILARSRHACSHHRTRGMRRRPSAAPCATRRARARCGRASPTPRRTRCAPSGCAGSTCPCCRRASGRCASCTSPTCTWCPASAEAAPGCASLAGLQPDLVVNTGDNLSTRRPCRTCSTRSGRCWSVPGAFVFGSNDYYGPKLRNPARYLAGGPSRRLDGSARRADAARGRTCATRFDAAGWVDLTNTRGRAEGRRPRDRAASASTTRTSSATATTRSPAARPPTPTSSLGVVHAPYLRVLDADDRRRLPLILAGPHPRRPAVRPRSTARWSPTATCHASRAQGPVDAHGRGRRVLAPRLGGLRHVAATRRSASPARRRRRC